MSFFYSFFYYDFPEDSMLCLADPSSKCKSIINLTRRENLFFENNLSRWKLSAHDLTMHDVRTLPRKIDRFSLQIGNSDYWA